MKLFYHIFIAIFASVAPLTYASVESHFNQIKSDPNTLYAFMKKMPKGGELHYHLAGGAYPETMIDLIANENYCIDWKSQTVTKRAETCLHENARQLLSAPEAYQNLIEAWSFKNFFPGKKSGHDHFFETFYKFGTAVSEFRPELLAKVMLRAANQHEQYMEIIILPDNARSAGFGKDISSIEGFESKRNTLLSNPAFKNNIHQSAVISTNILNQAREILGCEQQSSKPVCQLTIKFQYLVLREQSLDQVFSMALNGFEAASKSEDIVAVNLVQAEDGMISLRDYRQQMQIFQFMHQHYPNVHIALHAGELAPSGVRPSELRFHIQDAIQTGHAERIGHGTSIAYEDDADLLVQSMAKKQIPVEINLTSNEKILNVSGKNHPLSYYLNHHVPIVLSTDDEGILRTDLSREYMQAAYRFNLDYPTVKQINRNALTYSFLSGKSLWKDPRTNRRIRACENLESADCKAFISKHPKAKLQWMLENKLTKFERSFISH